MTYPAASTLVVTQVHELHRELLDYSTSFAQLLQLHSDLGAALQHGSATLAKLSAKTIHLEELLASSHCSAQDINGGSITKAGKQLLIAPPDADAGDAARQQATLNHEQPSQRTNQVPPAPAVQPPRSSAAEPTPAPHPEPAQNGIFDSLMSRFRTASQALTGAAGKSAPDAQPMPASNAHGQHPGTPLTQQSPSSRSADSLDNANSSSLHKRPTAAAVPDPAVQRTVKQGRRGAGRQARRSKAGSPQSPDDTANGTRIAELALQQLAQEASRLGQSTVPRQAVAMVASTGGAAGPGQEGAGAEDRGFPGVRQGQAATEHMDSPGHPSSQHGATEQIGGGMAEEPRFFSRRFDEIDPGDVVVIYVDEIEDEDDEYSLHVKLRDGGLQCLWICRVTQVKVKQRSKDGTALSGSIIGSWYGNSTRSITQPLDLPVLMSVEAEIGDDGNIVALYSVDSDDFQLPLEDIPMLINAVNDAHEQQAAADVEVAAEKLCQLSTDAHQQVLQQTERRTSSRVRASQRNKRRRALR